MTGPVRRCEARGPMKTSAHRPTPSSPSPSLPLDHGRPSMRPADRGSGRRDENHPRPVIAARVEGLAGVRHCRICRHTGNDPYRFDARPQPDPRIRKRRATCRLTMGAIVQTMQSPSQSCSVLWSVVLVRAGASLLLPQSSPFLQSTQGA